MIESYSTLNTKVYTDKLIFVDFNDQPIPYNYYSFLNDDDDDINNIPCTPVEYALLENEGVEYAFVKNYEDINDEIINDVDDSLASDIDPPPKRNYGN